MPLDTFDSLKSVASTVYPNPWSYSVPATGNPGNFPSFCAGNNPADPLDDPTTYDGKPAVCPFQFPNWSWLGAGVEGGAYATGVNFPPATNAGLQLFAFSAKGGWGGCDPRSMTTMNDPKCIPPNGFSIGIFQFLSIITYNTAYIDANHPVANNSYPSAAGQFGPYPFRHGGVYMMEQWGNNKWNNSQVHVSAGIYSGTYNIVYYLTSLDQTKKIGDPIGLQEGFTIDLIAYDNGAGGVYPLTNLPNYTIINPISVPQGALGLYVTNNVAGFPGNQVYYPVGTDGNALQTCAFHQPGNQNWSYNNNPVTFLPAGNSVRTDKAATCFQNSDCSGYTKTGEIKCQNECTGLTRNPLQICVQCNSVADCAKGQICNETFQCTACTDSSQCAAGLVCYNGTCQTCNPDTNAPCNTLSGPTPYCADMGNNTYQCVAGCTVNHPCVSTESPTNPYGTCDAATGLCGTACTPGGNDCPTAAPYCVNGQCQTACQSPNLGCQSGECCVNGACTTQCGQSGCTGTCTNGQGCSSGCVCSTTTGAGTCLAPSACSQACSSSTQCPTACSTCDLQQQVCIPSNTCGCSSDTQCGSNCSADTKATHCDLTKKYCVEPVSCKCTKPSDCTSCSDSTLTYCDTTQGVCTTPPKSTNWVWYAEIAGIVVVVILLLVFMYKKLASRSPNIPQ